MEGEGVAYVLDSRGREGMRDSATVPKVDILIQPVDRLLTIVINDDNDTSNMIKRTRLRAERSTRTYAGGGQLRRRGNSSYITLLAREPYFFHTINESGRRHRL